MIGGALHRDGVSAAMQQQDCAPGAVLGDGQRDGPAGSKVDKH
jgi:hypothetical protein